MFAGELPGQSSDQEIAATGGRIIISRRLQVAHMPEGECARIRAEVTFMKTRFCVMAGLILLAVFCPARAETIFEGLEGQVYWWLMAVNEHSPECLGGLTFQNEPYHNEGVGTDRCRFAWRIHCGADSLVLDFVADPDPSEWPSQLHWGYYATSEPVIATLTFAGPVELTAGRLRAALPETTTQNVTLTAAGGEPQELLGEDSHQDEVTVILTPGTYMVAMNILAEIRGDPDPDLRSSMRVTWREVTSTRDRKSWGAVKAVYR
jgi:hypothetical protein